MKAYKKSCFLIALFTLFITAGSTGLYSQNIPKPSDVFGFEPGADYKLANYTQMLDYYDKLVASSDRIQKIEIGKSVDGQPMLLLFISTPENLRQLDKWRDISEKLARAKISEEEALRLSLEGKAIVWIDGGMHANETAHGQMTPELAYRVVSEDTPEMQHIRENVIFLLMPMMNPDGLDIVAGWYNRNLGTPYETSPTPWLWQRYVGHDNNRDWFMANLPETQAVMNMLYRVWFPQIVYNQHQDGSTWKRMFVPPFRGPANPNIHPGVVAGVNEVGSAMTRRYALENKPGIISHVNYTMWWNGGGRTVPYYHNQIGILTEMSHNSPTPSYYDPAQKPKEISGLLTDGTSVFYPDPWEGGESHLRDAVDYMITSSMATLRFGADRRSELLYGIYSMGRDAIEAAETGGPFAYVIPAGQWDGWEATRLVNAMFRGGLEIHQATQSFTADGKQYDAGSYILYGAQSFRPYLTDLLERQNHPDRHVYPGGPPETPYDITGWTLPLQMGVKVDKIAQSFTAPSLSPVTDLISPNKSAVDGNSSYGFVISPKSNASFKAVNRLLAARGVKVSRVTKTGANIEAGSYIVTGAKASQIEDLGLDLRGLSSKPNVETKAVSHPKVATYMTWQASMDEGWTRWLLEQYETDIDTLHNAEMRNGNLSKYDAIILPSHSADGILHGYSDQQMPKEFTGGLGLEGTLALRKFVESGGTLLAFDQSTEYAIAQFGLPVRNAVSGLGTAQFFIPGSLIRTHVDTSHPIGYGMQETIAAMFVRGRAFDINAQGTGSRLPGEKVELKAAPEVGVEVVARYADNDILMSGWALGESAIAGKPAVVNIPFGKGNVVLFGFGPQFRAQPGGSYKLVFNSIINSTMK